MEEILSIPIIELLSFHLRLCGHSARERIDVRGFAAARRFEPVAATGHALQPGSRLRSPSEIKGTGPQVPWRELAGFRNVIACRAYLGVDLGAAWLVVEQDLPALIEAVNRMTTRLGP